MKTVLLVLVSGIMAHAQSSDGRIRVFVADSESWQASSFNVGGAGQKAAGFAGASQAGQSKFTVGVMAQLYKHCPTVTVVDKPDRAEYFVRVDQATSVWMIHQNMAVFNRTGDMIFAASSGKISRDVKRFCESPTFGPKRKKKS